MDDCINVYAIDAVDECNQAQKRVAVALSDIQKAMVQRVGMSKEQLIAQTCAQAGLKVLKIGRSEVLSVSLHCGGTKEGVEMRDANEVRCPLPLDPWTGCPPLLCTLYACDPFSTSCYAILATAEAVLAEERPP